MKREQYGTNQTMTCYLIPTGVVESVLYVIERSQVKVGFGQRFLHHESLADNNYDIDD